MTNAPGKQAVNGRQGHALAKAHASPHNLHHTCVQSIDEKLSQTSSIVKDVSAAMGVSSVNTDHVTTAVFSTTIPPYRSASLCMA